MVMSFMTNLITKICAKQLTSVQYKAALSIKDPIKCTSQPKLYKELGLEAINFRRLCGRLGILCKVKISALTLYLSKYITKGGHSYITRLNE